MKTFEEYLTEGKQMTAFFKPPEMPASPGSVSLKWRTGGASLKTIGDWRKITNLMDDNKTKSIKITSDLKKKVPMFVKKILDKVRAKGYEVELIDKNTIAEAKKHPLEKALIEARKYRKSISGGSLDKFKKLLKRNPLKAIARDIKKYSPGAHDPFGRDVVAHANDVVYIANAILRDWDDDDEPALGGMWEDFLDELDDLVMMLEEEITNSE